MPTLREMILQEAQQQGVDPQLALAVAQTESGMNPDAQSRRGARGIMQLMPGTAADLGVDPTIPAENIRGGVAYLRQLGRRFGGDTRLQLAAYNAGPGAVQKYGGVPPYKETQGYVTKIMGMLGPREAAAAEAGRDFSAELFGATPPVAPHNGRDFSAELFSAQAAPLTPYQRVAGTPAERRDAAPYLGMMPGFEFMGFLPQASQQDIAEALPEVVRTGAAAGINMAGSAGGAAAGALTSPVTGLVGPIVGEVAGSYGARKLNVALGLEEPGALGDIASVAVPAAVRSYQALKPAIARRLPGAGAALHAQAAQELEALPAAMAPPAPSATLYAQVAEHNPMIRPSNIWQRASEVLQRERRLQPTMRNARVANIADDLHQLIRENGGQLPLHALHEHQQRLGLMTRQAAAENWPESQALRRMYGAFYDDLDHAASQGVAGADLLRQANRAARTEFAAEDLATMFAPGHPGIHTRADGLVELSGGKLRDAFEKRLVQDDLFRGSFTPDQLTAIRDTFSAIEQLPRVPASAGQNYGSGRVLTGAAIGAAAGALTGSPTVAAFTSAAVPVASRAIATALMSDRGRAWLLRTLAAEGGLSPATLGLLSTAGRQAVEQGTTVHHAPLTTP